MKILFPYRRAIATLRAYCPSSFLIPGVLLGQLLSYYFGPFTIWNLGFFVILGSFALFLQLFSLVSILSLLLGFVSASSFIPSQEPLQDWKSYYVSVNENPSYPQPGGLRFLADIHGQVEYEEKSGSISYQPLAEIPKVLCKGVLLPWRNSVGVKSGASFVLRATFQKIDPSYNPFGWESHAYRRGIAYLCKARFISEPLKKEDSVLNNVREHFENAIRSVMGEAESGGLLLSLSIGTKDVLSDRLERAFKNTGLAHLLVVSGYQVTLIFVFALQIFGSIVTKLYPGRYALEVGKISALALCTLFVAILGWDQASLRACIALSLLIVTQCFAKGSSLGNILSATFLITQVFWPLSIFDPGVELTFMALLGMLCFMPEENCSPIRQLLLLSFGATLFTTTICVFWFGTLSLWGFVLNPIIAPVLSFLGCHGAVLSYGLFELGIDPHGWMIQLVAILVWNISKIVFYASSLGWFTWALDGLSQVIVGSSLLSLTAYFIILKAKRWCLSLGINK